ncbi:zinc-binding alcohol dehydrogenase [Salinisphaera sp. Q1T1-3]|uniref:zinc-dependent alcohol dehydrogenase n=1 Tax=Salinisphaera sp. Q1T1-3 TaxID=2321229 RepID=UPI000E71E8DA|nr:zinc-binding alcohol dehydrogenase [Salinisphaera sp. Q1T1-3]RJS92754.1 dehydrogenase [Salinisphaera sp. Q1T1-3]
MSQAQARALWLEPPNGARIFTERLPDPTPDTLVIRTLFSAVSRGTETLVYAGQVPQSEYARMRAPFQAGELPHAVKHGYANVGVVEAGPAGWPGRHVFCLYPHQTRYVVSASAVVPLPDDVPAARAVLAANVETAVNALWDAAPRVGDHITIVGGGVIGCLVAWLAGRMAGTRVTLVDINPARAAVADALGVQFAPVAAAPADQDLVFHASATAAGLSTALELAGDEADIIELSWYGATQVSVPLGGAFHARRLSVRASQVGTICPQRAARWDHARRLSLAVSLCADARLDVLFAIDAAFDTLPAVMARLSRPEDDTLCQRITYPEASPRAC